MNKVLVLGSGMVAGPLLRYMIDKGIEITVASNTPKRALELLEKYGKGTAIYWEASDTFKLKRLVSSHNVVVSLLPQKFHVNVAKVCIAEKRHMVTTSYVQPEMKKLNEEAKKAGVLILNECGLEPGLDHMSAMRVIDTIHGLGGQIYEFYSLSGALPAPDYANDNPFKYKFTWNPMSVLEDSVDEACYLKNGKEVTVPGKELMAKPIDFAFPAVGKLEVYPNQNALSYIKLYGIPEVETMFRGTIRYKGWCQIINVFNKLNLLSDKKFDTKNQSYASFMAKQIGAKKVEDIKQQTANFVKLGAGSLPMQAIEYLGLFKDEPMQNGVESVKEMVGQLMVKQMLLQSDEVDMSVMQHIFLAKYPDGNKEVIHSRLLDFGVLNKETSVARTVALPAACAAKLILDEEIGLSGVQIPVIPEVYNPILIELENFGLEVVEAYNLPNSMKIEI